ncbi:MAG: hypothetical protein AB1540_00470 [Bdellovibrionota bacterium]
MGSILRVRLRERADEDEDDGLAAERREPPSDVRPPFFPISEKCSRLRGLFFFDRALLKVDPKGEREDFFERELFFLAIVYLLIGLTGHYEWSGTTNPQRLIP